MNATDFDIAICGAGPVGAALALLLASQHSDPSRIAVLGKNFNLAATDHAQGDPRTLALNHGSRRLILNQLRAWPSRAALMRTVHVSQQGRLGRCLIQADELGVPDLGAVVHYDDLLWSLHARLRDSGVTLVPAQAAQARPAPGRMLVQHDAGQSSALLAVQCDGARPAGVRREYGQHALLTTVRAGRPQEGWAYERFTANGPLAALPHPDAPDLYGIVWCNSPERSQMLAELPAADFQSALMQAFGERLGVLEPVSARHMFPLAFHAGPSRLAERLLAVGNAAQTLHPVAGQGLNLGLRDVAQLAQSLAAWQADCRQNPDPFLARYARLRRPDRWLTAAITDTLPRLFATRNPLVQHACGLGLLAMDTLPLARKPFARQLLQGLRA
ncbi:FAD-dependent monooxygenase [Alcaligenes sp. WGS1538]|uniref:FAD-dependent monooxygenase n=1 Tax=Alcaligenes sp. WGS1538 TaxID=3366811 RepID=UPI00372CF997